MAIKKNAPMFVMTDETIRQVVTKMKRHAARCFLVVNAKGKIVGIVTESDIVRRVVLLDLPNKLERSITSVMSRNVDFVRQSHFEDDIARLVLDEDRHFFPVLTDDSSQIDSVAAILSVDSLAHAYVNSGRKSVKAAIICSNPATTEGYLRVLRSAGIDCHKWKEGDSLLASERLTVIADMDDPLFARHPKLRDRLLKWPGRTVFISSDSAQIVGLRRAFAAKPKKHAVLKPFDVAYLAWLLWRP